MTSDADPRLARVAFEKGRLPELTREVDAIVNRAFERGLLVETPDGRILRGIANARDRDFPTRARN